MKRRAEFEFATQAVRKYRLEGADDLAGGNWTIPVERIKGTGELLKFIDPNATGLKRYFYRLVRLP